MKTRILTATVSALAILAFGATAQAETVTSTTQTTITETPVVMVPVVPATTTESVTTTTKSYVQQKAVPGAPTRINFDAFDRNQDGTLSMAEVGEHLFFIFDTDGNEVIDNIEFTNKRVITIAPMEKHTLKMVDVETNGTSTETSTTYTYETFISSSGLTRFDDDLDGLSASEFIDTSMLKLDTDESKSIELDEWKKAYIASRAPKSADQDGYNN